MRVLSAWLSGACGVRHLSAFGEYSWGADTRDLIGGGCGWISAGFVNDRRCRTVYNQLTKRFGPPVFQTPVRYNTNSGRDFFFAIWDDGRLVNQEG